MGDKGRLDVKKKSMEIQIRFFLSSVYSPIVFTLSKSLDIHDQNFISFSNFQYKHFEEIQFLLPIVNVTTADTLFYV